MLKKGAIELSVNFLVIIIISIVIFGFGVYFIAKLSATATDLTQLTASELDQKIANLVCEGFDRVCIGTEKKVIHKKKFDVFGIKIFNVLPTQNFEITVNPPTDKLGISYSNTPIPLTSPQLIVNPASRSVSISQNEEKDIGIGVQVQPNPVPGIYILNVEIKSQNGAQYTPIQKLYVEVPN
ncbi:MAG TPA: hypothetical protein VJJ52_05470 [Candidatus Nanoarchaeia archaeon]|nr:hypothetical protein [Candidatus Nanoarchaeia archaeon]